MVLARAVRAAVVPFVLLAVVACTSDDAGTEPDEPDDGAVDEPDEPSRPAGLRVAVILPPASAVDSATLSAMASDVRRLDAMSAPEIAEVRSYRPPDADFVGDIAWALAEDEVDLICLLGRGSRATVNELAAVYPSLRFCASPLSTEAAAPESVSILELRFEELGRVLGVAAAEAAGDGPVGIVLGSEASPRVSFRDGLLAGLGDVESVLLTVDDELDASQAVERVRDEGAEVVVVDAVEGAGPAIDLAATFATVLGPDAAVSDEVADEQRVVTWGVGWESVLRHEIDRLLDNGEDAGPASFGFSEDVFTLSYGDPLSTASRLLVARVVGELTAGDLDPLAPADAEGPDAGEPAERDADADDDADTDDADTDDADAPDGDDGDDGDDDDAEAPDPDAVDDPDQTDGTAAGLRRADR